MEGLGRAFFLSWLAAIGLCAQPTFNKDVVPILQQRCQMCHHPGAIGSFSLMDYESARPYVRSIGQRVAARTMPVWKPAPGIGDFLSPAALTQQEIDTITQWADSGGAEGNPSDAPPPLSFPDGWSLGQPDLILNVPAPFTVAPGEDLYRCFSLATNLPTDRYVRAVEIRAGNRSIVHHAVVYPDPLGQSLALAGKDPSVSYTCFGDAGVQSSDTFLAAWAPGITPARTPAGIAMKLTAGTRLAMQLHYHPSATGGTDQSQLGIYFENGPVDKLLRQGFLLNSSFTIPAGNPSYAVSAATGFAAARHAVSVFPHMHLLGRTVKAQVTNPDRSVTPLLQIDDWDFDYQAIYQYREPVALPAGSAFGFTETFDNSADNSRNPNSPPRPVSWGTSTTDEMAVVGLAFTLDAEHLMSPQVSATDIVNSASLAGSASAPGTVVTLFGAALGSFWQTAATSPLPRTLANGVRVTVDGIDAPLFYASPSQVNFQVPFEVSSSTATVTLTRSDDGARQSVQLPMKPAHPGIYTTTGDGKGPAIASHATAGTVSAGSPAARGEWLVLYANGLGSVAPGIQSGAPPDGLSSTINPVAVSVGGVDAEVYFAGMAPGFVGLYQVNFRVPPGAPVGAEVPLSLSVAGVQSNVVKLSVR
jgi:uncharacterized protein (TIGR03437 family)